ncbi:tetratricopeptide repeat protein [Desertivirga xinjiangensis]|uniref:tetratricopeptide repeat protein n=1 Tax=Desertivirga xinjiangensis TaxID=539206 RepID=UPI00210B4BE8|nr:tetratricopeptide repeat protein [Pedobacter xinjiangensis]
MMLLLLIGFLVYANTLSNGFNLDDTYYTAGNALTADGFSSISRIFSEPTFYNGVDAGFDYRPVAAASFAIQHGIFGDMPFVSHFINLVIYLLTVIILFKLLLKWYAGKNRITICFLICLLFLLHPLHTEIVASIKSRDELLSLLFCLISLYLAFKYLENGKFYLLPVALTFFAMGLLAKYTLLPFLLIYPVCLYFFGDLSFKKSAVVFVMLFTVAICCHLLKASVLPSFERDFSITENALVGDQYSLFHRIATSSYVMGRYLLLHIFPKDLVFYYGANYVRVVTFTNALAVFSLLFHFFLLGYCLKNLRQRSLLVFGIILYGVFMLVFSNLIELAPGMMAERFTYVSSLGFSIVFVLLIATFYEKLRLLLRINPLFVILLFAAAYAVRTFARNEDWKNKDTLYAHDVQVADNSAMVNFLYGDWLLASALEEKKKLQEPGNSWLQPQIDERLKKAQLHFEKTLEINPKDSLALLNKANCLIQLASFAQAEQVLKRSLEVYPDFIEARFTLALSQKYQNRNADAARNLQLVLKTNPNNVIAIEQLNRSQLAIGDTVSALKTLKEGIAANPNSPVPLAEFANYYLQVKDTVTAVVYAEKAAALPPPNRGIFLFLARYFESKGVASKAAFYYAKLQ